MNATETVELRGHLFDSGRAHAGSGRRPRVRRRLLDRAASRRAGPRPTSRTARLTVKSDDPRPAQPDPDAAADPRRQPDRPGRGAAARPVDRRTASSPTTSTPRPTSETQVRLGGRWVDVENPEMDCGLLVTASPATAGVRTVPCQRRRSGRPDRLRRRRRAGRAAAGGRARERRQVVRVHELRGLQREAAGAAGAPDRRADARRQGAPAARSCGSAGPAVVHTGAAPAMVALVEAGFVDVLFAGNALATHDIESVAVRHLARRRPGKGRGVEHGHEHHIRAINQIRAAGSIAAAVEPGVLTGGVMHALVTPASLRARRARCATTARCPTCTPTSSRGSGPCALRSPASAT